MRRFSVYMVMFFLTLNLMGQNDEYEQYYRHINEHLSIGNCDKAQRLYDVFRVESGRKDVAIEQMITKCLSVHGATNTRKGTIMRCDTTLSVGEVEFKMVWVVGGTFMMGCTTEQGGDCDENEKPAHSVMVDDYYIGETEVTVDLFSTFVVQTGYITENEKRKVNTGVYHSKVDGVHDTSYAGDWCRNTHGGTRNREEYGHPVIYVAWNDAVEFCKWLSQKTGRTFRLPTEAEWEFAARGGNLSKGYKYSGEDVVDSVAWYGLNYREGTHPVKMKQANEIGLYDMSGNVKEWCSDSDETYSHSRRIYRGGSWHSSSKYCRVSERSSIDQDYGDDEMGFRLVMCP